MTAPQLTFEAESHAYALDGKPVPSVTLAGLISLWRS